MSYRDEWNEMYGADFRRQEDREKRKKERQGEINSLVDLIIEKRPVIEKWLKSIEKEVNREPE